ncbi:serine/threonine-protein kinase [Nevskia sp.]|uniref:serine/threonine-protein kinase n=1 Tax=Nevskia sp. TaxID=1929292 RepID=UPI0025EC17EA|nr:serine/threonine-protein kinase [Nevskia sp.]
MAADAPTPQQWAQLESLLDQLLDLPEGEREAFLDAQSLSPALRVELERWLVAEAESRDFLAPSLNAALLPAGEMVGAWRVLELIGQGGSGEVYRVERADGSYEQRAALKLLRRPEEADDLRRFAAERRMLARLEHPDIARLLDGGVHGGRPYAVLELVKGERFDDATRFLPLALKLERFLKVCEAVAHAHRHLIVHRDLKPANVLVTADGSPKLLDFGIAKPVDADAADVTQALRMTPDYCAPEQLAGGAVTAATDVFALGVMLYQLLTGKLPWALSGSGVQRALERLSSSDLLPPSQVATKLVARQLRGDLDAIVLKALRRLPGERYGSAEALAEDLRRHVDGRPVIARGEAPAYLLGRLLRRHRFGFAAAASLLLALMAGAGGIAFKAREAAQERDQARAEASRNAAVRDYLLTLFRVAGETPGADALTPKQLLDKGAERLASNFEKDPESAADTLLALAQLYFSFNDYAGAVPLFERVLSHQPAVTPDIAAQARYDLSQCYLRMSRTADAVAALAAAQAYWERDPIRHRNQLLESRLTQAQLERADGRAEAGIATLEAALVERSRISGDLHAETGIVLNNLAVAYFQADRLADADALFRRSWTVWETIGATQGVDALNTLNNWASLAVREQRFDEAEKLYRKALDTRRMLFGPSAALAALLNNLGKLNLRLDRPAEALPLLDEALKLARQYAGENSLNALAAQAGLGEAQAATGDATSSLATLDDLDARVGASFPPEHLLAAIAHLAQARRLAAASDVTAARRRLDAADAVLAQAGPQAATYSPQVAALRARLE